MMMMTEERRFLKVRLVFQQLEQFVQQAERDKLRIDQFERATLAILLRAGFEATEEFIAHCGNGDIGETITVAETDRTDADDNSHGTDAQCSASTGTLSTTVGRKLRRSPATHRRRYVSVFGEHLFERFVYAQREGQAIERMPVDEQLGLPAGEFSYVLQDWLQRLAIKESFEEASSSLQMLLNLRVSVGTSERMNQHLAETAEDFRVAQGPPDPATEEELIVYANDCKGVPMRRPVEERARRGPRRGKGEKANKKQMACVGTAYSVAPFVRTPAEIIDEVFREQRAADRPEPQNKRLWAEMTLAGEGEALNGKTRVFVQQALDLVARDPERCKTVVCLMDGEKKLRDEQHTWLPRGIGVLDIWHVIERLWLVAYCFHKEQSPEAERFVEDRLRGLLEGQAGYVIGYFRRLLASPPKTLTAAQRRTITSAITYFENNRDYMKYDEYLAAGYPIGSGVAEGACRHVVKDRMELTGMRWTVAGAQAMLHLRAIYLNGDWPNYLEHHIETEQATLYRKAAA
jgi:hypothetical protein